MGGAGKITAHRPAAYAGLATVRITTASASRLDDYREAAEYSKIGELSFGG